MSKARIDYKVDGTTYEVTGNSITEAARKINDPSGHEIFGEYSKPSVAALITRAKKNGIEVTKIVMNGKSRFDSEGQGEHEAEPQQSWDDRADEAQGGGRKGQRTKAEAEAKAEADAESEAGESQESDDGESQESESAKAQDDDQFFKDMAEKVEPHLNIPEAAKVDYEGVKELIKSETDKMVKTIKVKPLKGKTKDIGKQHYKFEDLLHFVSQRKNTLLVGPAGGFKTTATENVAEALGLKHYGISVGMMTTKSDFLGYKDAHGNYVTTQFREGFEYGGVFNLDELDAGNPNVVTTINMALSNGNAAFPDGMIKRHKDFVVIACANTFGTGADRQYVGRNQLDAATLDRFPVINWDYDEKLELAISGNKPWAQYIQKLRARVVKLKMRVLISPRMTIDGAQMLAAGMAVSKVQEYIVFRGLKADQKQQISEGINYIA